VVRISGSVSKCHGSGTLISAKEREYLSLYARNILHGYRNISVAEPGRLSRIPNPDFYLPDSGLKKHWIPDPQHLKICESTK
jgi:hypothetical protein